MMSKSPVQGSVVEMLRTGTKFSLAQPSTRRLGSAANAHGRAAFAPSILSPVLTRPQQGRGYRMKSRFASLALVIAALVGSHAAAHATPGDLDTSFGDGGIVTTDIGRLAANANVVLAQKDGGIVLAGDAAYGSAFALIRYRSDGSPDP